MPRSPLSHVIFLLATVIGTLMALFSTNWLVLFAGMELNMFAFIPLMLASPSNKARESALKYFLAQIFGSAVLIYSGYWLLIPMAPVNAQWFLAFGLLIKAGAAPAHQWFPTVMSGLTWPICFLLTTWQKVIPLTFMFYNMAPYTDLLLLFALGAFIGSAGGLTQTSTRGLLAYSSISHLGWMLALSQYSPAAATTYLVIYLSNTSLVVLFFASMEAHSMDLVITTPLSLQSKFLLGVSFFSLAGIPPFLGFLPKWAALEAVSEYAPWTVPLLLLASITSLFFYLKIVFLLTLKSSSPSPIPLPTKLFMMLLLFMTSNLLLLLPHLLL